MFDVPEKTKNAEKRKFHPRFSLKVWLSFAIFSLLVLMVLLSMLLFVEPKPVCGCTFEPYAGVTQTAAAAETLTAQAGS